MVNGWVILSRFLAAVGILLGLVMVGFLIGRVLAAIARRRERAAQTRRQSIAERNTVASGESLRGIDAEGRAGYIHSSYRQSAQMYAATSPGGNVQQPRAAAQPRRTHHLVSKAELNELCPTFEKTRKGGGHTVNHALRDDADVDAHALSATKPVDSAVQDDAADDVAFHAEEKCKLPDESDADPLDMQGSDMEEELCAVCLDDIDEGHAMKRLPCQHEFHAKCISKWVRRTNRCPLCNDKVKREDAPPGAANHAEVDLESGIAHHAQVASDVPSNAHSREDDVAEPANTVELQSVVVVEAR
ncbi:E3 ubiquitin-protein ligase [Porphyridium purpureum]|uniref:E3 ubiquitin-protein ligase n=1 Tax=Porphyridium purpureum TaxID=35688 RepID=A0A5J4Z0Y2_PORPP|nr:E3 ubiquitin-protein ligase [Porphyridium purpureum]|eukprot:POR0490..scf208_2